MKTAKEGVVVTQDNLVYHSICVCEIPIREMPVVYTLLINDFYADLCSIELRLET